MIVKDTNTKKQKKKTRRIHQTQSKQKELTSTARLVPKTSGKEAPFPATSNKK